MKAPYHPPSYIQSWQRTSPISEHLTRFSRLIQSLILFTSQVPLIALDYLFRTNYYGRPSWSFPQRCLRLFVSYGIWSFNPGTRPPRDVISDKARRHIPKLAKNHHASLVIVPPVPEKELYGDAIHESVKPEPCPCFWQWTDTIPSPLSATNTTPFSSRKVIMYFVGGGMVQGHPVDVTFPFTVSQQMGSSVFGVNFRKCVTSATAFPAALQDAISAFSYLLKLGYEAGNVSVMGDSGGGGIAITLVLYLLRHGLPVPGAVVLSSPFVDLVDDFLSDPERLKLDIVNPEMMSMVGYQYTENRPELRGTLLSPAKGSLPEGYSFRGFPRCLVVWGEVEVFRAGIVRFVEELGGVGTRVEVVEGRDCVHDYWMFSKDFSERAAFGRLREFMDVDDKEKDS